MLQNCSHFLIVTFPKIPLTSANFCFVWFYLDIKVHWLWSLLPNGSCMLTLSSCRVCSGSQPPHVSILHFRNVVYARSFSKEMCAARHDMVQVACDHASHVVFALPVVLQMFRYQSGGLSWAHSVGRPKCMPWQRVTTRESFFWVDVVSRCRFPPTVLASSRHGLPKNKIK